MLLFWSTELVSGTCSRSCCEVGTSGSAAGRSTTYIYMHYMHAHMLLWYHTLHSSRQHSHLTNRSHYYIITCSYRYSHPHTQVNFMNAILKVKILSPNYIVAHPWVNIMKSLVGTSGLFLRIMFQGCHQHRQQSLYCFSFSLFYFSSVSLLIAQYPFNNALISLLSIM